jgi:TetR/AcrR family transcriptional repressor of nem operon
MRNVDHATASSSGTAAQILDVAERLAQTRGYNGFSYADIAAEVGITKASLHYHFRTKADLGRRLIERYSETFREALESIAISPEPALGKLARYARLYAEVLHDQRMCLCGMLAAEYSSLPAPMQDEIRRFFDINEDWLTGIIEEGRERGGLRLDGSPRDVARLLLGALEGAMLVARPYADVDRFESAAKRLLLDLAHPTGGPR